MSEGVAAKTKRIYFVRHGQTRCNALNLVQPPNEPLNEQGLIQAAHIAERSKNLEFQKIIASDFLRAEQTASAIAEANAMEVNTSPLFRELLGPSQFFGLPHSEEFMAYLKAREEHKNDSAWHFADEENYYDVSTRADKAWKFLETETDTDILVVTHGLFLRMLVSKILLGNLLTPDAWYATRGTIEMSNTGITVCTLEEDRWQLLTWNDHAHFAE